MSRSCLAIKAVMVVSPMPPEAERKTNPATADPYLASGSLRPMPVSSPAPLPGWCSEDNPTDLKECRVLSGSHPFMPSFITFGRLPMLIPVMATSTSALWHQHQSPELMWSNDLMSPHRFALFVYKCIKTATRLKLQCF